MFIDQRCVGDEFGKDEGDGLKRLNLNLVIAA